MSQESASGPETELAELRDEVDAAERQAVRTVEFGRRAMVIAVTVFVLLIGILLPWIDGHPGWRVLLGESTAVPRLFAGTAIGFGVFGSVIALMTRRWAMCWVCAIGGWFASVDGVLAIWSQQTQLDPEREVFGPGIGLVIAAAAMIVLAVQWFRMAWSRP
ncbi:MAG: hypothetical protein GEU98_12140 [Pseudonocardiaceae bacterium]|nr:hypothetical protein [Pseudonocardiaceae bacterium]